MTDHHTANENKKTTLVILSGMANVGLMADALDHFFWHMGVDTFKCKIPMQPDPAVVPKAHHWDAVRFVVREHRILDPSCSALGPMVVPMVLGARDSYEFVISVASRHKALDVLVIHSLVQELKDKLGVPERCIHLEMLSAFGVPGPEEAVDQVNQGALKETRMGIFYKGPSDRSDYRDLLTTMGATPNEFELLNCDPK